MEDTGLQTRSMAVLALLRRGAVWGVLGALVGALLGYLFAGRTLAAALNGGNWAGLALGAFAGCLVLGHSKGRNVDAFQMAKARGEALQTPSSYPWAQILVALVASGVCALIWLAASRLLIR